VELRGLEPLTFSMPLRRAPNCATAPRYPSALWRGNDRHSATTTPLRLHFTVAAPRRVRPFRAPHRRLARIPPLPGSLRGWPTTPVHSLFRLVFPKNPHDPTLLLLYHKSAISSNLIHVAKMPRTDYGGVPNAMQSRESLEGLHGDANTASSIHTSCYGNEGAALRLWLGDRNSASTGFDNCCMICYNILSIAY
jgi:hypothetical protein